jgi:fibronectin-binding autotransporter adhesin
MRNRSIRSKQVANRLLVMAVTGASLSLSCPPLAHATTLYWDADASGTGNNTSGTNLGGAGSWNTTNTNWWDGSSGTDTAWGAGTTNSAIFNGTAGTVTIASTVPAGVAGLEFDTTGYVVAGTTLNFSGGTIVTGGTYASPLTATISANVIAQAATTVSKTGQGTLILSGTGNDTATTGSIFNLMDGTVQSNKTASIAIPALTFNIGDGTGAGGTAVYTNSGGSAGDIGASTVVNLNTDGVWNRADGVTSSIGNIATMTGQTIAGGTGTITLNGGALSTTVSGTNVFNTNINTSPGSGRSHTWNLQNSTDSLTFNGIISGTGSNSLITYSGPVGSVVTNSGAANTYTGPTTVNGATLKLNKSSGNAIPANSQALTIHGGGTIQLVGAGEQIGDTDALTMDAGTGGTLDLNGFNETISAINSMTGGDVIKSTVSGGTLTLNTATTATGISAVSGTGNLISANLNLNSLDVTNGYRRVTVTSANDVLEISGSISDSRSSYATNPIALQKQGLGKLILSGSSNYTGQTSIGAGILSINQDASLGAAPNSIVFTNSSTGTLMASNTFTLSSSRGISITGVGFIDVVPSNTLTYGGVIADGNSAGGSYKKTDSGTFTLTGSANIYSGATTISGGVLNFTTLTNGFGVNTTTKAQFTMGSNLVVLQGTDTATTLGLTTGMYIGSSSQLSAGTTITNIAPDGVTITMSTTDTNATTTSTATFGNPSPLGFAANAASALVLDGGLLGYSGTIPGGTNRTYSLTANGGGFSASGSSGAPMTISGSMTGPSGGTQTLTLAGTNTDTNMLSGNVANGSAGNITKLDKTGTGRWVLSASNSYTGSTTVDGGTLQFAKIISLPAASAITVDNTGTLAVNAGGTSELTNGTSGAGSIGNLVSTATWNTGSALGIDTTNAIGGTLSYSGAIAGNEGLTKLGTGTLTLTASNAYSGNTTIKGGTLALTGSGSISNSPTINLNGGSLDVSGVTSQPFIIGGAQTLKGSGTVSGAVTVNGTLATGQTSNSIAKTSAVTLTLGTGSTLAGSTLEDIVAANSSDKVIFGNGTDMPGAALATFGGTLTVTSPNTPGSFSFAAGQSYDLFDFGSHTGTFATVTLPMLTGGLTWNTSNLYTSGIVSIGGGTTNGPAAWTNGSMDNTWENASNWTNSTIPGVAGNVATFSDSSVNSPVNPNLTANETVGGLTFNGTGGVTTISANSGKTLAIDNSGSDAAVSVSGGNVNISAPLSLTSNANITVSGSNTLSVSGNISGAGKLTTAGSGAVTLTGSNSYGGGTHVTGGMLNIESTTALPASSALIVDGSAAVVINRNGGGKISLDLASLSDNGLIDLQNNAMTIHGANGGTYTAVNGLLQSGFTTNQNWSGTSGITTTTLGGSSLYTLGEALIGSDLKAGYTYYGDADMSGIVDGGDYTMIDTGFGGGGTGWQYGDFNYDGSIDGSDYSLIDNAFNTQTGSAPAAQVATNTSEIAGGSAVPEPASLGALGIGAWGLMNRRRRRA